MACCTVLAKPVFGWQTITKFYQRLLALDFDDCALTFPKEEVLEEFNLCRVTFRPSTLSHSLREKDSVDWERFANLLFVFFFDFANSFSNIAALDSFLSIGFLSFF